MKLLSVFHDTNWLKDRLEASDLFLFKTKPMAAEVSGGVGQTLLETLAELLGLEPTKMGTPQGYGL
jgi:hypothetical protein